MRWLVGMLAGVAVLVGGVGSAAAQMSCSVSRLGSFDNYSCTDSWGSNTTATGSSLGNSYTLNSTSGTPYSSTTTQLGSGPFSFGTDSTGTSWNTYTYQNGSSYTSFSDGTSLNCYRIGSTRNCN